MATDVVVGSVFLLVLCDFGNIMRTFIHYIMLCNMISSYISTVKYQKRLTPLLVIVQERVKTVQFCEYIINAIHISVL